MRCFRKIEVLQCLHFLETSFLDPARNRIAFPLFHLRFQQRFQIPRMRLCLLGRLFGQTFKLPAQRGQPQQFGVLPNGRKLQCGAH